MNKYLAVVIFKPDLNNFESARCGVLNLFEQNTDVKRVDCLGKKDLDFKSKKYKTGIYMTLDITSSERKIEQIRCELKNNRNLLSAIIMNNNSEKKSKLQHLKINKLPFFNNEKVEDNDYYCDSKKVYLLIKKNIRLPFSEACIVAISDDEKRLLSVANKKIREFIYAKGFKVLKPYKDVKDVEKELKKARKVQFVLSHNDNVGQELVIEERYLV